MRRLSLGGFTLTALAVLALATTPAAAVTPVTTCRALDKAGETYVLSNDLTTTAETCLTILADRITLDLGGHTITGSNDFNDSQGVRGDGRTLIVVKNGTIQNFEFGIDLASSSRSTIRNMTFLDNRVGMAGGASTLVKDCTARGNFDNAIRLGDGGQVEGCVIEGSREDAMRGGSRMLVTRNIIRGNSGVAIDVGPSSTVSYNTVTNNELGIFVGQRSLVTGNVTRGADETDIRATCPSTITNNQTSGDLEENIELLGSGCFLNGNT